MDPLSVFSSVGAILQLSATIISLLNDIKDKPADARKLILELSSTSGLLQTLRSLGEERQEEAEWPKLWRSLLSQEGPISNLARALSVFRYKLSSSRDLRQTARSMKWTFTARETRELLATIERASSVIALALTADHLDVASAVANEVQGISKEIQEIHAIQQRIEKSSLDAEITGQDKENKDLVNWLSPLNFWANQQDMSSRREEGTGLWFLEAPKFISWIVGNSPTLWCPGIPGSGKTILTSMVVDHLLSTYENNSEIGVAYIYCNYREQREQTVINLVGTVLQHLLVKKIGNNGVISGTIRKAYRRHLSRRTRPNLEEMTALLLGEVQVYDRTFLIIDALDECPEGDGTRESFLRVLRVLQRLNISILVTSRFIPSIQIEFEGGPSLEIHADTYDIRKFVQYNIQRHRRLERFIERDPTLQETIIQALVQNAQGMFLMAKLQMELIAQAVSTRRLSELLHQLPPSLEGVYTESMRRIDEKVPSERDIAHETLLWVSQSRRPLTVMELQCALSLEGGDTQYDADNIILESDILDVCGALITVERESNIVRLVHYSAKEYFEKASNVHFPGIHASITLKCLTCLSLYNFRAGPCTTDAELERRLEDTPLLDYAAKHWGSHMWHNQIGETTAAAVDLVQDENLLASAVQIMHLPSIRYPTYSQNYPHGVSGLQLAAYFGLEKLVLQLLDCGADFAQANDDYYGHPLQAAAAGGSLNVCRLLVDKRADVNAQGGRFNTALQAAADAGHVLVTYFLLETGADPNAQGGLAATPLQAASLKGHTRIARELLERGATVNTQITSGRTALHCAAMHGHCDIVELLLESGAEIDCRDNDHGRTALSWAAWNGHCGIIDLLLLRFANIDAVDHQNSTALHLALERHHESTVQILLDEGAKFDVVNASNKTQIQIALASIEKIDPIEFEIDHKLSNALDRGSQAAVSVLRRKEEFRIHKASFELVIRKAFSTDNDYATDIQRNLLRERQALQSLNHPNVVKYLKYEEDKDHDQAFLFTEYCGGGSLSRYSKSRKHSQALDLYATWSIVYNLAAALAYCHHGLQLDENKSFSLKHKWKPILHRDIKPANIVLSNIEESGRGVPVAKLCDMGWAKVWSDPAGYQTTQVGSLKFMPKEVREGGTWTIKGDVHSLGATLHDLNREFKDDEFDRLVCRCTHDDPSKRPSSFTLLEIATERLAKMTGQPLSSRLLPNDYGERDYLCQAVLETLDRLFISYRAVKSLPTSEAALRLKLLVNDWEKGENDILQNLNLETSPHFALILGDLEKVKILIRQGHKDSKGLWNTCGFTPLHIACREVYHDVVECWLAQNYEVNAQDDRGRSALHWVVIAGSLTLCNALLRAGADTELQDVEGSTALHRASEIGNTDIILALLNGGAKVGAKNIEDASPLHRAAANGKISSVQLLLNRGADPLATDKEGFSPAQSAFVNAYQTLGDFLRAVPRSAEESSHGSS